MSSPDDPLKRYRDKRAAGATPEPMGARPGTRPASVGVFVVHEHHATRTHWDLRLEIEGVLQSWAIPHGPTMDPDVKRLAVKVEAHPLEYCDFEAVIPEGNYGAGPMVVWDRGRFLPEGDPRDGVRAGEVKFSLAGYKLRGAFTLVKTGGRGVRPRSGDDWLLIKKRDAWAEAALAAGPLSPASVLSGLSAPELAAGAPRIAAWRAALAAVGAPRKTFAPAGFQPMLCETAEAPFTKKDWIFELKYDGYRLLGWGGAGQAFLRYRSGQDATARYPELVASLRALPVPGLVIDGEVVVLDGDGKPDFQALAERAQLTRKTDITRAAVATPVVWFVFDLLAADGFDLRNLPIEARKQLLAGLAPPAGPVKYAEHVPEVGEAFLAAAAARGLEGVVGKKLGSRYRGARAKDWLKLKVDPEDDFAVCGFTAPKGSRTGLGAVHLCVRDGEAWRYAGKAGSGLDDATLRALRKELEAEPRWALPFPMPEDSAGSTWIAPRVVVTVRFREWPEDSTLRFPVFVRRRDDKRAEECTMPARHTGELVAREADAPVAVAAVLEDAPRRALHFTNLTKVFWPAPDNLTKGDLIAYYRDVAPVLLPYLADRPVVITRYPDGIEGKMFYQKDLPEWAPAWLRTVALWANHSQRDIHYVLVDDADGLAYLANLASIPIHIWASRTVDLGRPDWTIIDLDPKGAPREYVVPLALAIHALCESIALPTYVKTSGQTGLHVLIPLGCQLTYEQARNLAYLIGMVIEQRHPTMATTHKNPDKRQGRVYLDWGQNAHGQLLVAPYSVRPVPGAPVSMPLRWHEVTPDLDPRAFSIRTARARIDAMGDDPVRNILTERPDLLAALARLQAMIA